MDRATRFQLPAYANSKQNLSMILSCGIHYSPEHHHPRLPQSQKLRRSRVERASRSSRVTTGDDGPAPPRAPLCAAKNPPPTLRRPGCKPGPFFVVAHSAGATAPDRCFSTPLTSTAITAVANTKPSAMKAVVPSTRSNPPRPCRTAIAVTAAPAARKVRK